MNYLPFLPKKCWYHNVLPENVHADENLEKYVFWEVSGNSLIQILFSNMILILMFKKFAIDIFLL